MSRGVAVGVLLLGWLLVGGCLGSVNLFDACIRNCAQCKKMFGAYFDGQRCADTCIKFKGKLIPDCLDVNSIGPFLINKFLD